MEADDLGTYVVKFTGAGQGRKALIAEVVCAQLARTLGLAVPELVARRRRPRARRQRAGRGGAGPAARLARLEPGRRLPARGARPGRADVRARPELGRARVLWFDALIGNVDRTWRNPNLLFWHGNPYLIDHGAALTFQHAWTSPVRPYDARNHALLGAHPDLEAAEASLAPLVTPASLAAAVARGARRVARARSGLRLGRRSAAGLCRRAARSVRGARGTDRAMTERMPFEYAVLRVVPRVERGEAINAGVIVYCRDQDFLGARVHLDTARLTALDPSADPAAITSGAAGSGRHLRRRRPGRGRKHRAALPLAHRAALDRRPARPGAHRPHRRRGGRTGPAHAVLVLPVG